MPCGYRQAFEVREVECSSGTSGLVRKGEREMEYCPPIFYVKILQRKMTIRKTKSVKLISYL